MVYCYCPFFPKSSDIQILYDLKMYILLQCYHFVIGGGDNTNQSPCINNTLETATLILFFANQHSHSYLPLYHDHVINIMVLIQITLVIKYFFLRISVLSRYLFKTHSTFPLKMWLHRVLPLYSVQQ